VPATVKLAKQLPILAIDEERASDVPISSLHTVSCFLTRQRRIALILNLCLMDKLMLITVHRFKIMPRRACSCASVCGNSGKADKFSLASSCEGSEAAASWTLRHGTSPTRPPTRYPVLLHYHPLDIYRHQVIKQAFRPLMFTPDSSGLPGQGSQSCNWPDACRQQPATASACSSPGGLV
jgi:hypothetical protein